MTEAPSTTSSEDPRLAALHAPPGEHTTWDAGNGYLLHFTNILAGGKPVQTYRIIDPAGTEIGVYGSRAEADAALLTLCSSSPETVGTSTTPSSSGGYTITHPLLRDLDTLIGRFIVLTPAARLAVALWVIHTWLIDKADQTPYLAISSPEPRCGKTALLKLLTHLVKMPWFAIGPSEAVVFRKIHADKPTLLLDEYDTIFGPMTADHHEGLRQMLNSGNERGARVPRCIAAGQAVQEFDVFCAKALGGIGTLPATVTDRSIVLMLKRKKRTETVERFRRTRVAEACKPVQESIIEFVKNHGDELDGYEPSLPDELNDRMQDACEPLIAIADKMGDGEIARAALVTLAGEAPQSNETTRLKLLRDVRTIYEAWPKTNMPTNLLLPALHALDPAWANYYDKGPLKDIDLAALLGKFAIKPDSVWIPKGSLVQGDLPVEGHTARGYKYEDLADAFDRYLPFLDTALDALDTAEA